MARARKSDSPAGPREPEARKWQGSFRTNGSYWAEGPGYDALTVMLRDLCSVRRMTSQSPAEMAKLIEATAAATCFRHLDQWSNLTDFDDWYRAEATNSAEAFLKYEGRGSLGTWAGGHFVPPDLVNHEPLSDADRVRLNGELLGSLDGLGRKMAVGRHPAAAVAAMVVDDAPPLDE